MPPYHSGMGAVLNLRDLAAQQQQLPAQFHNFFAYVWPNGPPGVSFSDAECAQLYGQLRAFYDHPDWDYKVDPANNKGFVRVEWEQFRSWICRIAQPADSPLQAAWAAINELRMTSTKPAAAAACSAATTAASSGPSFSAAAASSCLRPTATSSPWTAQQPAAAAHTSRRTATAATTPRSTSWVSTSSGTWWVSLRLVAVAALFRNAASSEPSRSRSSSWLVMACGIPVTVSLWSQPCRTCTCSPWSCCSSDLQRQRQPAATGRARARSTAPCAQLYHYFSAFYFHVSRMKERKKDLRPLPGVC
jgi:hypothetical protein